jgi:LuxR family maltose regulon positive regulatory protein
MVQDAKTFAVYFEQEVLSHLSAAEMDLLLRAAACTRFCASLCAAMLGRPEAVADASAVLARLERDNVFILPVESAEREGWYRLHPLLGEALRGQFDRMSAAERRQSHEAAWAWFAARGHIDDAVRHAVRAGQSEAAADLLERYAQDLYARGNIRSLLRLVRQLPPEQIQSRTTLRLWLGRSQLFAREFDACAATIEQLQIDIPESDAANRYALVLLRAALAIQRDDGAGGASILPALLEAPVGADASTVGGRNNILSWLYLRRGEFELARRIQLDCEPLLIDGAPLLGTAAGSLQGRCLVGLSYALEGRVLEAERYFRDALHTADQNGPACSDAASLSTAFLGEILYELNDIDGVLQLLESRVDRFCPARSAHAVPRALGRRQGARCARLPRTPGGVCDQPLARQASGAQSGRPGASAHTARRVRQGEKRPCAARCAQRAPVENRTRERRGLIDRRTRPDQMADRYGRLRGSRRWPRCVGRTMQDQRPPAISDAVHHAEGCGRPPQRAKQSRARTCA